MTRLASLVLVAGFCVSSLIAFGRPASATPSYEIATVWTPAALETLTADGLIERKPDPSLGSNRPMTRAQAAKVVARAIARLARRGKGSVSKADLDLLQRLMDEYTYELVLLGVRARSVGEILDPPKAAAFVPTFRVDGVIAADSASRQRNTIPTTITGGTIDPFVNAFLTSPPNNNPFEHDPTSSRFRSDNKLALTYLASENLAISVPIQMIQYNGQFSGDKYLIQPAVVLNIGKGVSASKFYLRGGLLDNLDSSRVGLTYRAPDATQQGPGFQNPVQPYENGVDFGGTFHRTHFQVAWSLIDQSAVNTFPGDNPSNYFLVVKPPSNSLIQSGAAASAAGTRTDTYVASAGSIASAFLSMKAAVGSVYISFVNGTVCNSSGTTAFGTNCPIGLGTWYYIDQTNQVVFRSPLPGGTTVQITYTVFNNNNTGGAQTSNYLLARNHINVRLSQGFKGLPGAELGFTLSRIFDSGNLSTDPGAATFGNGYGALSDTVVGFDGQIPFKLGPVEPMLYGEAASSKYTPDAFNTVPITDSAAVLGLKLKIFSATASVQYQGVGPDFRDAGPLRFLGPSPSTFQYWRGDFMPGFFGFANNLAQNRIFDATVTPGCAGASCSANRLTNLYPVFNPFVASGPQFFSDFAPNSQGFTEKLAAPLTFGGGFGLDAHLMVQHLSEKVPNGNGQLAFGPGFSSRQLLHSYTVEGGVRFGIPVFDTKAMIDVNGSNEHLRRTDLTAYAYVPFNPQTGGPDALSGSALNTYLGIPGNTPVLFFPNFVDEFHSTFALGLTLPVARVLDLAFAYNTQAYRGSNGTTLTANINQRKDAYGGSLTFNVPRTSEWIGFAYGMQKYTDSVLPTFNFSQGREDLTFGVRF